MKTKRMPQVPTPLILSPREEEILKAVYEYRFVTAQDITRLLLSRNSLTYGRSLLSKLAGGKDGQERQYLYRFPLPAGSSGNRERVFALGASGREFLASVGYSIDWYYRPSQTGRMNRSHLLHQLLLTRFICGAYYWSRNHTEYALSDSRLCYELARNPLLKMPEQRGEGAGSPTAIPDAWLLFQRLSDGICFPVLLEIDRGTEYQERFKNHVRSRLTFIDSGDYAKVFQTPAVLIAYATTGLIAEQRETRVKTMAAWTREVLAEVNMESWAGIFRFTTVAFETLYEDTPAIFEKSVWYRADSSSPMLLFG